MSLSREEFNEMFLEIITENQGLKLYKDNEASRFKELAVEFGEYLQAYDEPIYTVDAIYDKFLKERYENCEGNF